MKLKIRKFIFSPPGLVIIILIIAIIIIFFSLKLSKYNFGQIGNKYQVKSEVSLGGDVTREKIKNNNPGPTIEISNNIILPNSFMVETAADVSLALISDNNNHKIRFADPNFSIGDIKISPQKAKIITFKAPAPGKYVFSCTVPGHREKGESGEMIVSVKSNKSVDYSLESQQVLPGASMVISNGTISPNNFSVAPDSLAMLKFSTDDSVAHEIIFPDKTLSIEKLRIEAKGNKAMVLQTPIAGEYIFRCDIPGHEKETGKMIVGTRSNKSDMASLENEIKKLDDIIINQNFISPANLPLKVNELTLLTFNSRDENNHNLVFLGTEFKNLELKIGVGEKKSIAFKIPVPGTYEFHCAIPGHEGEKGQMIVK